ncbi:MAG: ATP-binding cassette domain-containing protein [Deltaproteobacteria bacterium]
MTETVYRLAALRQSYSGRCVLDIPELEIAAGSFTAVLGPSGSGKSTLLRLLDLLEEPHEGFLFFKGRRLPPRAPTSARREVTTVFQRPRLLARSVTRNVSFGLELRGREDRKGVADLLERVGLASLAETPAYLLSGGEQQRVALARALAVRPKVLLLDEATANLDPANVAMIEELITEEHRRRGMTIVFVTHNIFQARRLADRCALLLGGKLIAEAPTEIFFESPPDPRVHAFVAGEMVC